MEPNNEPRLIFLTSHANCHRGLSDYNDGCNLTHQLGNDDYLAGANLPEEKDENDFDGTVALGNSFLEEID